VQDAGNGDHVIVDPIVDDVLFNKAAPQTGGQIITRTAPIGMLDQLVQGQVDPRGVNIALPLTPSCEGIFEDGPEIVLGVLGDVQPTA